MPKTVLEILTGKGSHGPDIGEGSNGKPNSYRGIVEQTPALWINWIVSACKPYGVDVESFTRTIRFFKVSLNAVTVKSGFGYRTRFRCPRCGNNCDTLFALPQRGGRYAVGCRRRECLHLGYLSQVTKPSSRHRLAREFYESTNDRYDPPKEVKEVLESALKQFIDMHHREVANSLTFEKDNK